MRTFVRRVVAIAAAVTVSASLSLASPAQASPPPVVISTLAPHAVVTETVQPQAVVSQDVTAASSNPKGAWKSDTVYIQLHGVAKRWPVKEAAKRMDDGSPLKLKVVKTCPLGKQCIDVYDKKTISGSAVGETYAFPDSSGHIFAAEVYFENTWGKKASYTHRLNVAMHEIGHAVGMKKHSKSPSSIVYKYVTNNTRLSKADKKRLNQLY